MTSPTVDFVSDVICPWCYIGFHRLEAALGEDAAPSITLHPFQLDPSTPPEGADLRERLAAKIGGDPEALFARVEAVAKESGLSLDFAKVRRTPNTLKAHTLLTSAHEKGVQRALARALFEAYFVDGKDIGKDEVLVEIAVAHGYGADEAQRVIGDDAALARTRAAAQAMSQQGIRGVPFTIFGGKLAVSGAQPIEAFQEAYRKADEA